jgi:hypothetical protein
MLRACDAASQKRSSRRYFVTVILKGCRVVDTLETESQAERLGDDLLIGATAIAHELKVKPHQVNYIYKTKKWPIGKMGKQYIASKRRLREAALAYTA